jgi:hypothetical protein
LIGEAAILRTSCSCTECEDSAAAPCAQPTPITLPEPPGALPVLSQFQVDSRRASQTHCSPLSPRPPHESRSTRLVPASLPASNSQTPRSRLMDAGSAGLRSHWGPSHRLKMESVRYHEHSGTTCDSRRNSCIETNGRGREALRALDLSLFGQAENFAEHMKGDDVSGFVQALVPPPAFAARIYRSMSRPLPPTPAPGRHGPIPMWPSSEPMGTPRTPRPSPRANRPCLAPPIALATA